MFDIITSWLAAWGSLGVAALMLLENVFPPIPSELIMPFAGYLAADGRLGFISVVLAGTIGSVAGAYLWYWVGTRTTEDRMRRFIVKYGKWLTISESELDRAFIWFKRHGRAVVFFGRMIPGVRTLISVPAGLTRMPLAPFFFYTTLGSLIWTTALTTAGYLLKSRFHDVEVWLNPVTNIILIGIAVLYVWRLLTGKRGEP